MRPPLEVHHWARDRDGQRAVQTHMGPARARASKLQSQSERVKQFALKAVSLLLCGQEREQNRQQQLLRITRASERVIKTESGFAELHAVAAVLAIRAGGALRPCCKVNHPALATLADRIAIYAVTIGIPGQRRAVFAFVAAAIQFLAVGHVVRGTTVIPKLAFVAAHAPAELQHGALLGIQCRAVSAASRLIVDKCVGKTGFANPDYVFPFTPWRRQGQAETATPTRLDHSPESLSAP